MCRVRRWSAFWCVRWAYVEYKQIRTLSLLSNALSHSLDLLSHAVCCLLFRSCSNTHLLLPPPLFLSAFLSICSSSFFRFWLILFFTQITAEHTQQIKLRVPPSWPPPPPPPSPPTLFDKTKYRSEYDLCVNVCCHCYCSKLLLLLLLLLKFRKWKLFTHVKWIDFRIVLIVICVSFFFTLLRECVRLMRIFLSNEIQNNPNWNGVFGNISMIGASKVHVHKHALTREWFNHNSYST